jgi:exopolyphosphatase / guanosine-5'-triphosphate,3'-diphosphate pyrophosphatase
VICACIDIGSNTTRLLVAEPAAGRVRELLRQRAFTRIGKGLARDDTIPRKKINEVVGVVATQVRVARELGSETIRAVATAAIREAANQDELVAAIADRAGLEVEILTDEEEARLAFVGATSALDHPPDGDIAVIDVGGASSEIAIGTIGAGVRASSSFRIGSGMLADAYLRSDPPSVAELQRLRAHIGGTFEGFMLPTPELAVAVGGSATALRRLVGTVLDHESLERGLRILATTPSELVARNAELEPERVRLLPAGLLILEEISGRLERALGVGRGGLREGVILDMLIAAGWGHGDVTD